MNKKYSPSGDKQKFGKGRKLETTINNMANIYAASIQRKVLWNHISVLKGLYSAGDAG